METLKSGLHRSPQESIRPRRNKDGGNHKEGAWPVEASVGEGWVAGASSRNATGAKGIKGESRKRGKPREKQKGEK